MTDASSQTEPRRKSRRFYVILVAAILALAIILGVVISELSNVGQTSYGPGPVDIEVTTDKPFYLQGEEVYFVIYVNNPHDWPVPYPNFVGYLIEKDGLSITGGGVSINYAIPIPTFPAHSRTLYSPNLFWNQKMDLNGTLVQVQPGNYTLTVYFDPGLVDYGNGGNCTFEIRPKPKS